MMILKKERAFCYSPPKFEKKYLENLSLDYVSDENLEKKYASEIEKAEDKRMFLTRKRYEILKRTFIDSLKCITELDGGVAIAHFKNKDVCINNWRYLQMGNIIKTKFEGVKNCYSTDWDLNKTDYFGKSPLILIDNCWL